MEQPTSKEIALENFLRSALASMEMRSERGFSLEVPINWVKVVHNFIYGEEHGPDICRERINAARRRKEIWYDRIN